MIRITALLIALVGLSACANMNGDKDEALAPLGQFKLGHLAVVAPAPEKLLISRDATPEEWVAVVDKAFEDHFRRFEGDQFYHFGISVEAFSLPPPVVPGKSALALRLTVWEDATQQKLNEESKVLQIIKVFESRITKSREETMETLARDAAKEADKWLREQIETEGWFGGPEASVAAAAAQEEADVANLEAATEAEGAVLPDAGDLPEEVILEAPAASELPDEVIIEAEPTAPPADDS